MAFTKVTDNLLSSGVGTGAGNILELDSSGKLPAVDGSAVTALTSANLTGALPALDGSNLTGISTPSATITSVDITDIESESGGSQTFIITGTGFVNGDIVSFVGADGSTFNASTTAVNSTTQLTAAAVKSNFSNASEPYDLKVIGANGGVGILENQIYVDNAPIWSTSSGLLGAIYHNVDEAHFTLLATDADGESVAYSETGASNITGAGLTLNSSTGVISGDATDVVSATTVSFIIRATAGTKTTDRSFSLTINPSYAWDVLGGILNPSGDALNSSASKIQMFLDPADTNSYSGTGTSITNRAYALGSANQKTNSQTWSVTNMTLGGAGAGQYFTDSNTSSSFYVRASANPLAHFSHDTTMSIAYCGWWYTKLEYDASYTSTGSQQLWILNDGDWGPNAQVGIRLRNHGGAPSLGGRMTLNRNTTNEQQTGPFLPSMTMTNKWLFVALYADTSLGQYRGTALSTDTNLSDSIDSASYSFTPGTAISNPLTIGARPDYTPSYNPSGTRMGAQMLWGTSSSAFIERSIDNRSDAKSMFEQIFDATKSNYA
jgi:hypothetical protein